MKVTKTAGKFEIEFDGPPKIESRKDAINMLDLLTKAEGVANESYALKAIKDAIEKGVA